MTQVGEQKKAGVRIAIEGCGHGTLHAIYASVEQACRVKGWDGVDLLIIGGDFQAVRNQYDLNVTAMPPKYRRMADFHEYYSGSRTAPYPTIFIGGNHEASNHLFELYYGGWVAPNIYYLGAANVVRLGPLRIAGLTGIWKGYDYRKPHFERLPYNQEDINSIYHVRELDVRKLLSLRSQVDIGLSHDWPQGVEYHGDYNWLFNRKPDFGTDSYAGKLGSVAARHCLDRLRPAYWFSAHLHTKFAAIFQHTKDAASVEATSKPHPVGGRITQASEPMKTPSKVSSELNQRSHVTPRSEHHHQVSAWQQFHASARQEDAEERDKILKDREDQRLQEERISSRSGPGYSFDETFNKIDRGDDLERTIVSTSLSRVDNSEEYEPVPNLDGCFYSRPTKRQRLEDDHHHSANGQNRIHASSTAAGAQMDGANASLLAPSQPAIANPDAIDIDMSDDEDSTAIAGEDNTAPRAKPLPITDAAPNVMEDIGAKKPDVSKSLSEESEDGGVKLNPQATSFTPMPGIYSSRKEANASHGSAAASRKSSDSTLSPLAPDFQPQASGEEDVKSVPAEHTGAAETRPEPQAADNGNEVSEDMRAQLAALSSNFTPKERVEVTPPLPFPEEITNKTTYFLALGKCEVGQEFLQLLEVDSMTSPDEQIESPLKLSYDPEWLAIQRVFAPELQLGGSPTDRVPAYRGETYYHEEIAKEQEWINEHVVKPGKLQIPENFTVTAPMYDPSLQVEPDAMPREVTNPQIRAYCDLIGIENKFDVGEEERDFRMQQGPRPESAEFQAYQNKPRQRGHGGRGRGGHRGRGGGRGGDGSRARGRGRGRGR